MTEVLRLESVDVVRGGRQLLADIDLTVNAGEHWALIGANGAGKSTMLTMCGAQQHPTRGSVFVLGRQLDSRCRTDGRDRNEREDEPVGAIALARRTSERAYRDARPRREGSRTMADDVAG
jgi:ATPase subunit of ABC transporter with duplicated ATPase domains